MAGRWKAQKAFESVKAAGESFILQGITLDATKAQASHAGASQEAKKVRKFSIAMAFIFSSHVLAFPSIDLIFQKILRKLQPTWATNLSDFSIPPNIFTSMQDYLVLVAKWIEDKVLLGHRYIRACDAIHKYNSLFYRIGVYTIMELFFMAGLRPFLTVYEVFGNPSCPARFLAAFYSYIARSEQDLWTLLQPSIHDGLLAPTMEQCLRYADWFLGWDYSIQLFDVFVPTFLATGLQAQTNLGHLIFGEDAWLSYGGKHCGHDDPITAVYCKYSGFHTRDPFHCDVNYHCSFRLVVLTHYA
ncbi:hypothetical protein B0H10DRAFT_1968796 [Mycena sp. CBHHK59/15]|nr:hypothetical protein B0H10DRAFT_1968796 [Mycena sp. CBHHK59/15]